MNYDINGILYKVSMLPVFVGVVSVGGGTSRLFRDGDYGLEMLVAGVVVTGASMLYRGKCRSKSAEDNSQPTQETDKSNTT